MALKLSVEVGAEYLVPFAKNKLKQLKGEMEKNDRAIGAKHIWGIDGSRIHIRSAGEFDWIRITGTVTSLPALFDERFEAVSLEGEKQLRKFSLRNEDSGERVQSVVLSPLADRIAYREIDARSVTFAERLGLALKAKNATWARQTESALLPFRYIIKSSSPKLHPYVCGISPSILQAIFIGRDVYILLSFSAVTYPDNSAGVFFVDPTRYFAPRDSARMHFFLVKAKVFDVLGYSFTIRRTFSEPPDLLTFVRQGEEISIPLIYPHASGSYSIGPLSVGLTGGLFIQVSDLLVEVAESQTVVTASAHFELADANGNSQTGVFFQADKVFDAAQLLSEEYERFVGYKSTRFGGPVRGLGLEILLPGDYVNATETVQGSHEQIGGTSITVNTTDVFTHAAMTTITRTFFNGCYLYFGLQRSVGSHVVNRTDTNQSVPGAAFGSFIFQQQENSSFSLTMPFEIAKRIVLTQEKTLQVEDFSPTFLATRSHSLAVAPGSFLIPSDTLGAFTREYKKELQGEVRIVGTGIYPGHTDVNLSIGSQRHFVFPSPSPFVVTHWLLGLYDLFASEAAQAVFGDYYATTTLESTGEETFLVHVAIYKSGVLLTSYEVGEGGVNPSVPQLTEEDSSVEYIHDGSWVSSLSSTGSYGTPGGASSGYLSASDSSVEAYHHLNVPVYFHAVLPYEADIWAFSNDSKYSILVWPNALDGQHGVSMISKTGGAYSVLFNNWASDELIARLAGFNLLYVVQ